MKMKMKPKEQSRKNIVKALSPEDKRLTVKASMRVKTMIIHNVPADIHAQFKLYCVMRDYSISGRLRKFMKDCVAGRVEDL